MTKKQVVVKCENPACKWKIMISQSKISPPPETPKDHIHERYDPDFYFSVLCKHCAHYTITSPKPVLTPPSDIP